MKRTALAALAALAITSTGALAANGDAWYGTNRDARDASRVTIDTGPRAGDRVYFVEREPAVIVEREPAYLVSRDPAYVYYYDDIARDGVTYDPHHPQQGLRIERGLFNRKGPNDFGG